MELTLQGRCDEVVEQERRIFMRVNDEGGLPKRNSTGCPPEDMSELGEHAAQLFVRRVTVGLGFVVVADRRASFDWLKNRCKEARRKERMASVFLLLS